MMTSPNELRAPTTSLTADARVEPPRYEFADALRGIAALGVLLLHTHQDFGTTLGGPIWGLGEHGVQLFYIVSAYSLALSIRHRSRHESSPWFNYGVRRLLRIAPLFYIAVVIYCLTSYLPPETAPVDLHQTRRAIEPWHVVSTVLFVNGWHYESINLVVPIGWSVAVESNFYLLLPLILRWATSLRRAIVLTFAAILLNKVLSSLLYLFVVPAIPASDVNSFGVFIRMWLPSQLPVFVMGIAMFWLLERYAIPVETRSRPRLPWVFVLGLSVSIALASNAPSWMDRVLLPDVRAAGVLLFASLILAHRPYRIVVNRFTVHLGKISYGLYLLHFLVLHMLILLTHHWLEPRFGFRPDFFSAAALVMLGTIPLAALSYRYVETPGQNLGRKWIRRLEHG